MAMLWVLNLSDGRHRLIDIAERSALPFTAVRHAADALRDAGLLRVVRGIEAERSPSGALSEFAPALAQRLAPESCGATT
jgi:hypothetical protein